MFCAVVEKSSYAAKQFDLFSPFRFKDKFGSTLSKT